MTWFKLAGEGAFHEKVVEAGNEAYGAWCRAGQWSCQHLTDGRIPRAVALTIAPVEVWDRLVAAKGRSDHGLVEPVDGGWQIHDFLEWNPSAAEELAKREADRARKASGRKSQGRGADGRMTSSGIPDGRQPESKTLPPVPYPIPYPDQRDPDQIPAMCDSGSNARARREQAPSQDTHMGALSERQALPDAAWLAAEVSRYPAISAFAVDVDLIADLAGGLQSRALSTDQASALISAFVTKEGKEARGMTPAEFQKRFGGYVANARLRDSRGSPMSQPQFPEVREALAIFAERWRAANNAVRVEDADDAEHAAACIEQAKKAITAANSDLRPRDIYRRAVDAFLADRAPWLADAQWPLRMLASKFSSYASVPTPKPRLAVTRAQEEPPMRITRRASIKPDGPSGNIAGALALVPTVAEPT